MQRTCQLARLLLFAEGGLAMNDLELRQEILDELEYEPAVNAAHVGAVVDKGVVTLSGYVESYPEKLAAVTAAQRVKGVRAVADEVEVRHPADKKTSDDEIAKRAVSILGWDTVVPDGAVQLVVHNGWVTLQGTVDWYYQRQNAEADVRMLSGVRGVTNSIEINPRVHPGDIKRKIEDALRRHAEVEAATVRVAVRDGGTVLLEGTVGSWAERTAAERAVWSAPGVRVIDDRLSIA